jgi:hypothetical protein
MAVLTTQQQQQVAAYFSQNCYVALGQTASNSVTGLQTAIGQVDAIAVTTNSISAAVSVTGTFTIQQMELLLAYVLMKRAGVI